ncbi:MAG: hypothetical protein ABSB11_00400 [Sedimentisphaerales bacterium]|jgi:hypothetical protein
MKTSLMRVIVIVCVCCASVSFASLPQVIGNFEDSNDGWTVHSEAGDGTTLHFVKENATLGNYSLKVFAPSGWQKAVTCELTGDANALAALGKAAKLQVDVTLKAKEWSIGTGWVKAIECIVIQDDFGGWQQIDPTDGDTAWDGSADKTVTVTFDIPAQTPPDLTHGNIIIITNYDGVTTAGNFYFDNVRLVGAGEPNKPKEAVKAVEPNKPKEPNKPAK